MSNKNNINEKIRLLRVLKGLKQDDVSRELGITQRAYSKIETGETRINIDFIEKISKIFQMEPQDVLNFNPETFIQTNSTYNSQSGGNNHFSLNQNHVDTLKEEVIFLRKQIELKDLMIKNLMFKENN